MEFQRVFSGRIESVRQHYVSPTGMREFECWFKGGKRMFYQRSQKQMMLLSPGLTIRFTATKVEPDLFWIIDDVLDYYTDEQMQWMYHEEQKTKRYGNNNDER